MARKLLSEKTIPSNICQYHIGTLNRKNPQSFYVEGGAYISPKYDADNKHRYDNAAYAIKRDIIDSTIQNENLFNRCIVSTESASDRLKQGKWSYLAFQVHFRQVDTLPYKTLQDIPLELAYNVVNTIQNELNKNGFDIKRTKMKEEQALNDI